MTILLRDGIIYFGTLTSMHILHITFSCLAIMTSLPGVPDTASYLSIYINPLTNILVSAFLDDLRKAADARGDDGSSTGGSFSIQFVDSIALPLPAPTEHPAAMNGSHDRGFDDVDGSEAESPLAL
ncbi:hypothetical protein BD413DRAFT_613872 [Trametes elegans]|nr:hypothetical protein BD413DRAFT_613872 [Trametes elegans]